MPSLIYIADPMCSWCYGFGPELTALLDGLPGLPLNIVVGGLRTGNDQPVDRALKASLREHWAKVAETTGLPFSPDNLEREGFVYDTEPACRAVVAARTLAPQASLAVFHAIQRAFYKEGKDVTQGNVLAQVTCAVLTEAGVAIDPAAFLALWNAEAARLATREDFIQVQHWEIQGFPTLVLERDGQLDLVIAGFAPMPALVKRLEAMVNGKPGETSRTP
jgi:putative protein-disulfide isomerase